MVLAPLSPSYAMMPSPYYPMMPPHPMFHPMVPSSPQRGPAAAYAHTSQNAPTGPRAHTGLMQLTYSALSSHLDPFSDDAAPSP